MTIIKIFEVGLGLTVALFMGGALLQTFYYGSFSYFNLFGDISYLIGYRASAVLFNVLCGILVVMSARWLISFVSSNGGQTPNQNGN